MCWNSRQLHEPWGSSGAVEACAAKPAFVGFFLQQPLSVGDSLVTGVELEGPISAWSGGCRGNRAWANAVVKVQTFSAFWYDVVVSYMQMYVQEARLLATVKIVLLLHNAA